MSWFKSEHTKWLEIEVTRLREALSVQVNAVNEARRQKDELAKSSQDLLAQHLAIAADFIKTVNDLKSAHAAELNRVIEENRKLHAQLGDEESPAISTSRQESGPGESSARNRPLDDTVSLAHLLVSGTPFQRVQARYALQQISEENARLFDEREKLVKGMAERQAELEAAKKQAQPDTTTK